jgi:hypothetical protein
VANLDELVARRDAMRFPAVARPRLHGAADGLLFDAR